MSEYRAITGQYRKYYTNEPLPNATINIKLLLNAFTLAATYPTGATGGADAGRDVTTDENGNLPANLVLFASGLAIGETRKYKVTDPDGFAWEFVLPAGSSPVSLQELRANGLTSVAPDTVLALIGGTDLGDLRDMDFSDLEDGDVPMWNASSETFVNRQIAGGPGAPSGSAGGVLSGNYPNPGFAVNMATQSELDTHANNQNNPHLVTKTQIGLSNVNNTSDANKPVSTATQTALSGKADLTAGIVPLAQLPESLLKLSSDSPAAVGAVWVGSQAQYDAIPTKNATTLYLIQA